MSCEVSNDRLKSCGEFIGQSISDKNAFTKKINSSEFNAEDIYDSQCLDYTISGMLAFLSILELNYDIIQKDRDTQVVIRSVKKQIDFNNLKQKVEAFLKIIREKQIDILKKEFDNEFENQYLSYGRSLVYLFYYYGMKVTSYFLGINIDGKYNATFPIDIDCEQQIISNNLDELRRQISDINIIIKKMLKYSEIIKTTNLRIETLNMRQSKLEIIKMLTEKNYTKNDESELQYIKNRINYFNTEQIKNRNELRESEDKLNEYLKKYLKVYLGLGEKNE